MTSEGLQEYGRGDRFTADGSEQLVREPAAEPAAYRARFEGGLFRCAWPERGIRCDGHLRVFSDATIGSELVVQRQIRSLCDLRAARDGTDEWRADLLARHPSVRERGPRLLRGRARNSVARSNSIICVE